VRIDALADAGAAGDLANDLADALTGKRRQTSICPSLATDELKGLSHHDPDEGRKLDRLLRQIKGYLWNGNIHDGHRVIDDLVMDLECIETDYPSIKALRKAAGEFEVYIRNNAWMIPNYAERRRYGERVSTGFVESAVNTVVGKRFGKRQQMRWSKPGAHLMLQARTRTLDGTLRKKFEQWYPGLKTCDEAGKDEQLAA